MYQDLVLWAWLEIVFSLKRYTLSPVKFVLALSEVLQSSSCRSFEAKHLRIVRGMMSTALIVIWKSPRPQGY